MRKLRTFISSLQDADGGLALSLGEKADPNNAFLIKHLIELNMQDVAEDFKTYLLNRQNSDGGWRKYGEEPSMVSVTANVVKGLVDTGVSPNNPAIQRAVTFLIQHQCGDGGFSETVDTGVPWMKPGVEWGWITAMVAEALCSAGYSTSSPAFISAVDFARKRFLERREGVEGQSIIVRALRTCGINVEDEVHGLKRRIDVMEQDENGGFPKGQTNLDTTLNVAYFLYETGFHENHLGFKRAVNFLASCRNEDGGWPGTPGGKSVLWATLETAALLRKLRKF